MWVYKAWSTQEDKKNLAEMNTEFGGREKDKYYTKFEKHNLYTSACNVKQRYNSLNSTFLQAKKKGSYLRTIQYWRVIAIIMTTAATMHTTPRVSTSSVFEMVTSYGTHPILGLVNQIIPQQITSTFYRL
jgi:hypothetical protein